MPLLPQIYQKEIRREKILRLSFLFLLLASIALFIGIIFMLPSYFTITLSATDVFRRLDAEKKAFEGQDISSFEEKITKINQRSVLYANNESRRHYLTRLLIRIVGADNSEIRLNNIDLGHGADGSFSFSIKGTATTRDAFLLYVQRLKDVPEFASVYSPINNLLRESDIHFELNILINKESYFYAANQ